MGKGREKERQKMEKLKNELQLMEENESNEDSDRVAIIQKYYRAYKAREEVRATRESEMAFLGMITPAIDKKDPNLPENRMEQTRERRKEIQRENKKEMENEINKLKKMVEENEGQDIRAQMIHERETWIANYFELHEESDLPKGVNEFYTKDKVEVPITPEEAEKKKKEAEQAKKASQKAGRETEEEAFKRLRKAHGAAVSKAINPEDPAQSLQSKMLSFTKMWDGRDEDQNFDQRFDREYLLDKVRPEVHKDIEKKVDELIDVELQCMRLRYGIGVGKPPKPTKPPKPKKVNIPGEKQYGTINVVDFLPELIEMNILRKLSPCLIKDFIGEHNLLRGNLEKEDKDNIPDPSFAQLRQVITEFIGIPLGTGIKVEETPNFNQSFLFYGPPGTGKTMMVRALANETNAILLDLSAENLFEKELQDRPRITKLFYAAFKVATMYEPAIIYIDGIEHYFKAARPPKTKGPKFVPKGIKFKRDLLGQINKRLTNQSKVAVIATTSKPMYVNIKDCKIFAKKFFFPYPNYWAARELFKHFIEKYGGKLVPEFPLGLMAHYSEAYPAGSVYFLFKFSRLPWLYRFKAA